MKRKSNESVIEAVTFLKINDVFRVIENIGGILKLIQECSTGFKN